MPRSRRLAIALPSRPPPPLWHAFYRQQAGLCDFLIVAATHLLRSFPLRKSFPVTFPPHFCKSFLFFQLSCFWNFVTSSQSLNCLGWVQNYNSASASWNTGITGMSYMPSYFFLMLSADMLLLLSFPSHPWNWYEKTKNHEFPKHSWRTKWWQKKKKLLEQKQINQWNRDPRNGSRKTQTFNLHWRWNYRRVEGGPRGSEVPLLWNERRRLRIK